MAGGNARKAWAELKVPATDLARLSGDLRPPGPLWAIQLECQKSRKGLPSSLAVEPEVVVGLRRAPGC